MEKVTESPIFTPGSVEPLRLLIHISNPASFQFVRTDSIAPIASSRLKADAEVATTKARPTSNSLLMAFIFLGILIITLAHPLTTSKNYIRRATALSSECIAVILPDNSTVTHYKKLSTLTALILLSLPSGMLYSQTGMAGPDDLTREITEDFGAYSTAPEGEAQTLLTELGDWQQGQNFEIARQAFYARTKLPTATDLTQQLVDFRMAVSAEREAQRILSDASSEQATAFAYAIAPWLNPDNDDPADTITTVIQPEPATTGPDPALLASSTTAVSSAISRLDTTLVEISDAVEALY